MFLVPTSLSLLLLACVYGFYFGELWTCLILFVSAYFGFSLGHWVVRLVGELGTTYSGRAGLVSQEAGVVLKSLSKLTLILSIPAVTLLIHHGMAWYFAVPLGLVIGFLVTAGIGMAFAFFVWNDHEKTSGDQQRRDD